MPTANILTYFGQPAQLTISRVSEKTFEIRLAPLGPDGQPLPEPFSEVLIAYPREVIWSGPATQVPADQPLRLDGGRVHIEIAQDPLRIGFYRDGELAQVFSVDGETGALGFRTEAPVYGLGQGGPQFDRRGKLLPMRDGWGTFERPTHGSRVAAPMLIGVDGWALFVHHPISSANVFDLTEGITGNKGVFKPDPEKRDHPLKFFVSLTDEPGEALSEYRLIAGPTPMPPIWSLGYMQSHRTLASREELLDVAYNFRARNIPADAVIYLGTGFTYSGWNKGHGNFEFNERIFDEPEEIFSALKDMHFNVVLHTYSPPVGLHGSSISELSDDSLHIRNYWLDKHEWIFDMGVDGWWPDGGEGLSSESRVARFRMYWEGPLYSRPNVRPWNINRTGYSGAHRYGGWIWSGDPDSYWRTLETHIAVGLNHVVSLTPYWGVDIGGFIPTPEFTGELYLRWLQFSVFTASMRGHGRGWHLRLPWGWNTAELGPGEVDAFSDTFENGYPNPEELRNALVEPVVREFLQLRYRLLPYNYTLFRETYDSGLPPMRAMWLHYPDDPVAVSLPDQYMWGRDLLIAPVYTKGAKSRELYLPEGNWFDFWTHEMVRGGGRISRQVDLGMIPVYVRAGAIIPLDPVRQYTTQEVSDPTSFRIYPGANGTYRWYRDDGSSQDYLEGAYAWTLLSWDDENRVLTIAPDPDNPGNASQPVKLRLKLVAGDITVPAHREVNWQGRERTERAYRHQIEKMVVVDWDGTRTQYAFPK